MASIRERGRGVWEVRAFVGRDGSGKPIQVSRTVRGGKKDARRVAAELTEKPSGQPGRQTVAELLSAWQAHRASAWALYTKRDQAGRSKSICRDRLAGMAVGRLRVTDVDSWLARQRAAGRGEGALRTELQTLRAALTQAQRWGWIAQNPAALASLGSPKQTPRGVMTTEDVHASWQLPIGSTSSRRLLCASPRSPARRGEWSDLVGSQLTIDSALVVVSEGEDDHRRTVVRDTPTKTGDRRVVAIDQQTLALIACL